MSGATLGAVDEHRRSDPKPRVSQLLLNFEEERDIQRQLARKVVTRQIRMTWRNRMVVELMAVE